MDGDNIILQNWNEQLHIFNECLDKCRQRPTKNPVHDLRVAIKKIRSYLRLKQKLTGQKWKSSFTAASYLFKAFGKLRDIDISLTLSRKYCHREKLDPALFNSFLSNKHAFISKWVIRISASYDQKELTSFAPQFDSNFSAYTPEKLVEKIMNAAEKNIQKAIELAEDFEKNVHLIRKLLKDVYYWAKICPSEKSEELINLKHLDKMVNSLGIWQDHFVARKKLKYYKREFVKNGSEENESLNTLEQTIEKEQEESLAKAKKYFKSIAAIHKHVK